MEIQLFFLDMVIKWQDFKRDIKAYIQYPYPYINIAPTVTDTYKVTLSYTFDVLKA